MRRPIITSAVTGGNQRLETQTKVETFDLPSQLKREYDDMGYTRSNLKVLIAEVVNKLPEYVSPEDVKRVVSELKKYVTT